MLPLYHNCWYRIPPHSQLVVGHTVYYYSYYYDDDVVDDNNDDDDDGLLIFHLYIYLVCRHEIYTYPSLYCYHYYQQWWVVDYLINYID